MASSVGSVETVWLLIEHGANVTVQNETHLTPLHLASSWVSSTTAPLLLYRRADVYGQQDTDFEGCNNELSMTKVQMVQLLIEQGVDVTMQDATYSTPLHLASYQGSAKTVQLLIESCMRWTYRAMCWLIWCGSL